MSVMTQRITGSNRRYNSLLGQTKSKQKSTCHADVGITVQIQALSIQKTL